MHKKDKQLNMPFLLTLHLLTLNNESSNSTKTTINQNTFFLKFWILFSGENVVLRASYRRKQKDIEKYTSLLPFFGTDYGLCTLIKPQITFNRSLEKVPFEDLMRNYTQSIKPGIQLGKENGLSILLDAEVYLLLSMVFSVQTFAL